MRKWIPAIMLVGAVLACNLPTGGVAEPTPDAQDATVEQEPVEPAPEPTAEPTATPPEPTAASEPTAEPQPTAAPDLPGTFSTGERDVADLPGLEVPATGAGPAFCEPPAGDEPGVGIVNFFPDFKVLCLYNFPTDNGTRFTVEVATTDFNRFAEFYIDQGDIYDANNVDRGDVQSQVNALALYTDFPAWLPRGEWTISANTRDGAIDVEGTVNVAGDAEFGFRSVQAEPLILEPLLPPGGDTTIAPGDNLLIAGREYPPNTEQIVAVYQIGDDTSGLLSMTPVAATVVTTDAAGFFTTAFTAGEGLDAADYYVIVDPFRAAAEGWNPFMGRFTVTQ